MDNIRERGYEESFRGEHERRSSMIDSLDKDRGSVRGTNIDTLVDRERKQHRRKELHTVTYTTSIVVLPLNQNNILFPLGLHLPDESDIGSLYLENQTSSSLFVYEGPGGGGRVVGYLHGKLWKIISIADNISSVSIVIDTTVVIGQGLVIATIFSHKWPPNAGVIT